MKHPAVFAIALAFSICGLASADDQCPGDRRIHFHLGPKVQPNDGFLVEMKSQFFILERPVTPVLMEKFVEPTFAVIRRLVASQLYGAGVDSAKKEYLGRALVEAMRGELDWLRKHRGDVLAERVMTDGNLPLPRDGRSAFDKNLAAHGAAIDEAFAAMERAIGRAEAEPASIGEIHRDYVKAEKNVRIDHLYSRADRAGSITQYEILERCRPAVHLTGVERLLPPVRQSRLRGATSSANK